MTLRVFYAAGPGDVIRAHEYWVAQAPDPTEVSVTFSSQVEDCCRSLDAKLCVVGYNKKAKRIVENGNIYEHRPKRFLGSRGFRYHLSQLLYSISLLRSAVSFRADVAIIESGTSHYFLGALFKLAGIPIVTLLHNTLWPKGFIQVGTVPALIRKLDALFFRWGTKAVIGVSPECLRQVKALTGNRHPPLFEIRAQFIRNRFSSIPPAPAPQRSPFRVMYIGRINRIKGVFDILEIARRVEQRAPGRVAWELCGSGPDLDRLREVHSTLNLANCVTIHGWVTLEKLQEVYTKSHMAIIPTRTDFAEGLAMTAAEAILAGRPVLTNSVVPALEVLRPACVEAKTNDVDSYVECIIDIISDPQRYKAMTQFCPELSEQFYDRSRGLTAVLTTILAELEG